MVPHKGTGIPYLAKNQRDMGHPPFASEREARFFRFCAMRTVAPQTDQHEWPSNPAPMQQPSYVSGTPSWMQDDGSSSDHPIHNPGDVSGDRMNSRYQGGLMIPLGTGFPAQGDGDR